VSTEQHPATVEPSLDDVWASAWSLLVHGQRQRQHSFHQGVLATMSARGPAARYVVLRGVDRERGVLAFHTDARSPKLAEIQAMPKVSWCFHGQHVQLRLRGTASIHRNDAPADNAWQLCSNAMRRAYLAEQPPGSRCDGPVAGAYSAEDGAPLRPDQVERARANFALVQVRLVELDWLHLAASGHRRAGFLREGERWLQEWRLP
jgi:hypothetical protein